jgi:hypothetical protein
MAAAIVVSLLIGAALGLRFKVLILVPATGLVLAIVVAEEAARGDGRWQLLISSVAVAYALQFGFIVGGCVATFTGGLLGKLPAEAPEQRRTRNIVKPIA